MLKILTVATLALALSAGSSFAKPCRDDKGKFTKCPAAATKQVCRDDKGKFAKCDAPGAKPVAAKAATPAAAPAAAATPAAKPAGAAMAKTDAKPAKADAKPAKAAKGKKAKADKPKA